MTMPASATLPATASGDRQARLLRLVVIGLIGFLTLVDLFAAQAILPTLVALYETTPAVMGVAVNASTIGMAVAALAMAIVSRRINRRTGATVALALLSIPTVLLAFAPDITAFTALRIVQGVFMVSAFTLTMAYLAEQSSAQDTSDALAAYITGAVASNLVGRLVSGSVADLFGVAPNFFVFAGLNLAGAALVFVSLRQCTPMAATTEAKRSVVESWRAHLTNPALQATFAIGFLILFAFIGTFTYVNFVLAAPPIALSPMYLGLVYFVFAPAMITTPAAGRIAARFGARLTFNIALVIALIGLPLLLVPSIAIVLFGLVLVGVGTFLAQATATGFVGQAAQGDRAAASGLYLASYYAGGLAGAAVLGQIYERLGWPSAVLAIGISLILCVALATRLRSR